MLHYWLPLSPNSASRFDPDLWQAYVKANKVCSPAACLLTGRSSVYPLATVNYTCVGPPAIVSLDQLPSWDHLDIPGNRLCALS